MRELYRSTVMKRTNCGGPDQEFERVLYVVEQADVGVRYEHYMGHNQRGHRIAERDVGAVAARYMQPGYVMWCFVR